MGEVYLARDASLGRRVALKLLPAASMRSRERLRRFKQEAHVASALNHPNIVTIYEVGQVGAIHYIATEYVEGETLRKRISRKGMRLVDALEVSIQIASALSAAHQAGVVHRDIKPENVIVRRDGIVKVVDFGLAKLTQAAAQEQTSEAESPPPHMIKTDSGVVMGTVGYMSPEQAQGLGVDARTDIWSLGVVLYEMLAGRLPFEGATPSHTVVSILEREPVLLTRCKPEVPAAVEWIVTKALLKDREDRYQAAREMLTDLRQARRTLEVEAELHRSATPDDGDEAMTATGGQGSVDSTQERIAAPTLSVQYVATQISRHITGASLAILLLLAALAGGGYGLYRLLSRNEARPTTPFQAMKITRLPGEGNAVDAAISPDGRYVAYVLQAERWQSLRVRQVATSSDIQVVPSQEAIYAELSFSPDGSYVFYVMVKKRDFLRSVDDSSAPCALYRVPVLGGASQRIITDIDSSIAFSPDGKRFAFVRADHAQEETVLLVANADGTGEQRLATRSFLDPYIGFGSPNREARRGRPMVR
ncbi:MAG: protein kinase [Pyrinomonadaceae bacterium]